MNLVSALAIELGYNSLQAVSLCTENTGSVKWITTLNKINKYAITTFDSLIALANLTLLAPAFSSFLSIVIISSSALLLCYITDRLLLKKSASSDESVTISNENPNLVLKTILFVKAYSMSALCYTNLYYLIVPSVITTAISLVSIYFQRYKNYSFKFPCNLQFNTIPRDYSGTAKEIRINLFHKEISKQISECPICLDSSVEASDYFCKNHAFHSNCIEQHIKTTLNNVIMHNDSSTLDRVVLFIKETYSYFHFSTRSEVKYAFSFAKRELPRCPCCRELPLLCEITGEVVEKSFKDQKDHIYPLNISIHDN